jgi:transcriptional regulator
VPEVLAEDETLTLLARLVENFEQHVESPLLLDPDWGAPVARGTVGFRLPIDRFICKVKLSQDKDQQSQRNVIAALRVAGPYQNRELADRMERELFGAE